jgi:hypothetical protein
MRELLYYINPRLEGGHESIGTVVGVTEFGNAIAPGDWWEGIRMKSLWNCARN